MRVLDAKRVGPKLREYRGNLASVARHFGVTRQAVQKFVASRPALRAAYEDCREAMKDDAEAALHESVLAREGWAVQFYLRTQARDRGYGDRVTVAGDPGAPLAAKVYVADDDFDPDAV
jgi:hypothetical protein